MEKSTLTYYNEYSIGKIRLRDIPVEKINRWILIKASEKEPEVFLDVVLELYETDKLMSLGLNIRQCLNLVSVAYKNQDVYLRLFRINPLKIFRLIPYKFLTQEICNEYFRINPSVCLIYIPYEFRTKDMYKEAYKDDPVAYFNNLPDKYKTYDECNEYADKYLCECFDYIPDEYKTQEMYDRYYKMNPSLSTVMSIPVRFRTLEMWKVIIINTDDERILKKIPRELLNQEICNILFDKYSVKAYEYIPDEFKTREMCMVMLIYSDNLDTFKKIPKRLLDQSMCNMAFNKHLMKSFEDIPIEFRTNEMYIKALQENLEKYLSQVPREFYDDELFGVIIFELQKMIKQKKEIDLELDLCLDIVKLYPTMINAFSRKNKEEIIRRELYLLISNGGTLKSISMKYGINTSTIVKVLEMIKDEDIDSYMEIKKILKNNEDKYLIQVLKDVECLGKIISLLGDLSVKTLTSEQKVKFAYLYNKYVYYSLEEIYAFNKRCFLGNGNMSVKQEKIDNAKRIDEFFKRFLKFNYVFKEDISYEDIVDTKTILLNNSWLKEYDRDKFFSIKDGVPTAEYRYGKDSNLLTFEIEEYVISRLKSFGIPLNNYIVQLSFREYFNGNLDEYIAKFLEYDMEFEVGNKNQKGKK